MTVSSTTNKVSYSGNGSTTVFAYTFKIFADADLKVFIRSSAGVETLKTLTTHYTVSNAGNASGGNVTFTTGNTPASGETVVIQRELALTQGTDYVENDPFPAESHEDALDRLTFITQQQQEEIDRAIKASVTNTISGAEFTVSATDRANKVFAFDSSGDLSVTQELGTFRGNWAASTTYVVRDLVKDTSTNNIFIVNEAHTSSGSEPLTTNANSAKYDLIVDAATATSAQSAAASSATAAASSATAAASDASTATTQASNASSSASTASTQASNASASATAAAESAATAAAVSGGTDIGVVAGLSADIQTLADIQDGTVASTAISSLAALGTEIQALYAQLATIATKVNQTATTGSAEIPVGTTAQRDSTPATGMFRFNSQTTGFEGYNGSAWGEIGGGGGATGGGSDQIFYENGQTVTTNYTISTNSNAMTVGPVSVNSGIVITIPTGSRYVVI
jgi:hypothetical protein